ncbi:EutP/PduV family microcompartment system protein [Lentilactobacillus sp. Marseille-Q4993]|uniref:EutP/PduV family microcompartment system protein n=1 Tax=Lentilactobacillus sp. Marseille-Q4993 TaxID=3039492 RepID=UPI0024BCFFCC|nr:EutP/PduV family microcompartment system protein [Lentilactobacillus sp. Marseille-Q4993]
MRKKAMLIGAVGCGKTTLIQAMHNQSLHYNKTQSLDFYDDIIDTPGEYVEHRPLYSNLMTTSVDAALIVLIQSATDKRVIFPPGFTTMFSMDVIGLITKTDEANADDIEYARRRILDAGVSDMMEVSAVTGDNLDQVRNYIESHVK